MNDFQFLLPDGSYRTTDQERFSAAYRTGAVPIEALPEVDVMSPSGMLETMHHKQASELIKTQGYKLSTSPRPLRFASPDGQVGEVRLGMETEAFRRGGSLIPAEVSLDKPVVPQVKTEAPSEPESPFHTWLGPAPKNPQSLKGWDEYQKVLARNKEARMGFWRALVPGFESIPFVGTVSNLLKSRSIVETAKRLRDKKPVSDQDLMDLNLYLAKQQEVGDASWGGKVGRVIRDSLTFAAEFKIALVPFLFGASKIAPKLALNLAQRATQGALAGSRVAGKASKYLANPASNKALYQMLSADQFIAQVWRPAAKDFAKGIFGAELGKFGILAKGAKTTAAQKAAGVLAEMSAFALPNAAVRVGSQLAASTAAGGEPATFRGNQEILSRVLQGDNPDETVAFWQGVGSEFIEAYTEAMGRYLTKGFTAGKNGIGKLTKDAGSSLGKAIDRMLAPAIAGANKSGAGTATLDLLSNKAKALSGFMTHMLDKAKVGGVSVSHVRKVFTDMGYDGVLEEMLEERAADFFNGLMGWTSYDRRAGEENDDMAIVRAFKNMWPTLEQLSVEAAAFSAPIGVSYLAPIAANPAAFIREAKNASELNMAAGLQTAHLQGKSEQDLEKFEKAARARVLDPGKRQETGEVPAIRQAIKHRLQQEKFFEEAGERDGKIARAFNVLLEKLFSARYHPTEGIVLDPEVGFLATMSAPVVQYAKLGAKRYEEREKAAGKPVTEKQLEEAAINSGTRALLSLGNTIWAYNRLKEEGREKDGLTDEELPFYLDAEEAKVAIHFGIVRRSPETGLNYLFPPDSARAAEIESFLKSGLADLDPATGLKALRGMVEKASGHAADKVKSELENARAAWETLMKKLETVGPAEAQQLANQGILYGTEFDLGNENAPGNRLQTALFMLPLNPESQDLETLKDPKKWTQASLLAKLFNSKEPMTPAEFDAAAALIGVDALYTGRTWKELRDEDFSIVPRIMAAAGSGAFVNKGDDLIDSNGVIRTVSRLGNEKNRAVAYYETADQKSPGIVPLSEIGLGRTWSVHRRQETDRDQLGLFFADNTNRFVGTAQEIARQIGALGREVAASADEKSALKALSPYLSDGTAVRLVGRKRGDQQLFGLNKAALAMRHGAISIVPARLAGLQGRSLAEDVVESVIRGLTRTFDKETGRFEWNSEAFRGQFGSLHDAIEKIHAALAKKKAEGKDWSHREEQVFSTLMRFGKSEAMDVEIVSNFLVNYALGYENMDHPQVAQTYRMFRMLEPFRDSLKGALVDLEAGARGIMGDALFEALRFKAGAEAAKRGAATAKKELTTEDAIKRGEARVAEQADRLVGVVAAEEQRRRDEEDAAAARAKADLDAKLAAQRAEQEREEKARRDEEEKARKESEEKARREAEGKRKHNPDYDSDENKGTAGYRRYKIPITAEGNRDFSFVYGKPVQLKAPGKPFNAFVRKVAAKKYRVSEVGTGMAFSEARGTIAETVAEAERVLAELDREKIDAAIAAQEILNPEAESDIDRQTREIREAKAAKEAAKAEKARIAAEEKAAADAKAKAAADAKAKAEEEARKKAEAPAPQITKQGSPVQADMYNSVGPGLSMKTENALPLQRGYAYRTVAKEEVAHLVETGYLVPNPALAGQSKRSRGQTRQKMFSELAPGQEEAYIGTRNIVLRVPRNLVPAEDALGRAVSEDDIEVLSFDGKTWVVERPSEFTERVVVTPKDSGADIRNRRSRTKRDPNAALSTGLRLETAQPFAKEVVGDDDGVFGAPRSDLAPAFDSEEIAPTAALTAEEVKAAVDDVMSNRPRLYRQLFALNDVGSTAFAAYLTDQKLDNAMVSLIASVLGTSYDKAGQILDGLVEDDRFLQAGRTDVETTKELDASQEEQARADKVTFVAATQAQQENEDDGSGARGLGASNEATMSERNRDMLAAATIIVEAVLGRGTADMASVGAEIRRTLEADGVQTESGVLPPWYETLSDFRRHVAADNARRDEILDNFNRARKTDLAEAGRILFMELVKALPYRQSALLFSAVQNTYGRSVLSFSPDMSDPVRFEAVVAAKDGEVRRVERPTREELLEELRNEAKAGIIEPMSDADMEAAIEEVGGGLVWRESNSAAGFVTRARAEAVAERLRAPWLFSEQGKQLRSHVLELVKYVKDQQGPGGFWGSGTLAPKGATKAQVARAAELSAKGGGLFKGEKALADSEIRLGYVLNEAEHPKAPDWKKAFAQHFAETVSLVLRGEIDQDFVDQFKTQAGFNGGERVRNAAYHLWLQLLLPMYGSLEAFEAGRTEEAIASLTGLMEGEDGATGALRKALGIAPGSRFGEIAISAESSKQLYGNPEQPLAKLIELFDATDVKLSGLRTATGLAGGKAYPGWTVATPLARAIEKVLRTDPLFAGGKMAQVAAGKLSRDEAESLEASDLSYDGIMRVLERALRKTWNDFHAEVRGLPSPRPGSIFLPVLLTGDKSQVLGTLIPVEAYTDLFGTPMGEYASFEEFREAVYGAPGGRPGLARAFERAVLDAATDFGIKKLDPVGAADRAGRFKRLKDAFKRLSQIGTPSIPPLLNVEGALRTDADGLLTYVVPLHEVTEEVDGKLVKVLKALKGPGDGLMWLLNKFAKAGRVSYSAAVLQGMMKVGYWGPIGKALRQIKGALTEAPGKDTDGMPALHLADWSGNETPLTPGKLSELLDSAEFGAEAPNAAILLTGNVLKLGDPDYEKKFQVGGQWFGIFRAPALGVVSPMPTDAEARRFRASAQAWAGLLAPVANDANPGIASKYAKIVMDEIVLGAAGRVDAAAKRSALDYFVGMADRHSAQAAWAEDLAEEGVDLSSPTGFPYSRGVYFAAFARRVAQTAVDSGFYKAVLSLNSASAALSDGKLAPATNAPIEYGPDGSLWARGRGGAPVLTDSLRRPGSGRSPLARGAARLTIHPDKPVPAGLKRALGRPDMKDTETERNLEAMNLARHLQEEFGLDEKGFRSTLRILQRFQQPFRDDSDFIPLDNSTPFGSAKEDALRFIAYLQARQLLTDLADVDPEDGSPRIEYGKAKISDYSADGVLKEDLGWHYEEDASGNKKTIGVTVPGIVFLGDRNPHVGSVQSGRPMRLSRNLARASAYIHQGIMAQVGSDEDGDWQHVFVARPQALIALHRIDEQLPDDIFGKQSTASPDRFSDSWSKEERDSWVERLLPVDADLITDPRVVRASRDANMFSDSAIGRAATALTALNLVYSRLRMPEIKGFRKTTDGDPLYLVRLTLAYDMTQRIVDGAKVPELMMGIGLHEELVPLFMAAIAGYEIPDTDLTGLDLYRHAHAHTVQKFTAYLNNDRKGRQIKKLVVEDGLKLEKAFLAVYGRQLGKNDANGWKLYGLSSIADQLSAVALGVRVPYKFRPHTTLDVLRTHNNLKVLMESEGQEGQPPAIDQFPAGHPYRTFAERVLAPVYEKLSAEVSAIEATLASHPAYALPLERHVGEGLFEAAKYKYVFPKYGEDRKTVIGHEWTAEGKAKLYDFIQEYGMRQGLANMRARQMAKDSPELEAEEIFSRSALADVADDGDLAVFDRVLLRRAELQAVPGYAGNAVLSGIELSYSVRRNGSVIASVRAATAFSPTDAQADWDKLPMAMQIDLFDLITRQTGLAGTDSRLLELVSPSFVSAATAAYKEALRDASVDADMEAAIPGTKHSRQTALDHALYSYFTGLSAEENKKFSRWNGLQSGLKFPDRVVRDKFGKVSEAESSKLYAAYPTSLAYTEPAAAPGRKSAAKEAAPEAPRYLLSRLLESGKVPLVAEFLRRHNATPAAEASEATELDAARALHKLVAGVKGLDIAGGIGQSLALKQLKAHAETLKKEPPAQPETGTPGPTAALTTARYAVSSQSQRDADDRYYDNQKAEKAEFKKEYVAAWREFSDRFDAVLSDDTQTFEARKRILRGMIAAERRFDRRPGVRPEAQPNAVLKDKLEYLINHIEDEHAEPVAPAAPAAPVQGTFDFGETATIVAPGQAQALTQTARSNQSGESRRPPGAAPSTAALINDSPDGLEAKFKMSPDLARLHNHRVREVGLDKASGSAAELWLRMLRAAAEKSDRLREFSVPLEHVEAAEAAYYSGDFAKAIEQSELALMRLHQNEVMDVKAEFRDELDRVAIGEWRKPTASLVAAQQAETDKGLDGLTMAAKPAKGYWVSKTTNLSDPAAIDNQPYSESNRVGRIAYAQTWRNPPSPGLVAEVTKQLSDAGFVVRNNQSLPGQTATLRPAWAVFEGDRNAIVQAAVDHLVRHSLNEARAGSLAPALSRAVQRNELPLLGPGKDYEGRPLADLVADELVRRMHGSRSLFLHGRNPVSVLVAELAHEIERGHLGDLIRRGELAVKNGYPVLKYRAEPRRIVPDARTDAPAMATFAEVVAASPALAKHKAVFSSAFSAYQVMNRATDLYLHDKLGYDDAMAAVAAAAYSGEFLDTMPADEIAATAALVTSYLPLGGTRAALLRVSGAAGRHYLLFDAMNELNVAYRDAQEHGDWVDRILIGVQGLEGMYWDKTVKNPPNPDGTPSENGAFDPKKRIKLTLEEARSAEDFALLVRNLIQYRHLWEDEANPAASAAWRKEKAVRVAFTPRYEGDAPVRNKRGKLVVEEDTVTLGELFDSVMKSAWRAKMLGEAGREESHLDPFRWAREVAQKFDQDHHIVNTKFAWVFGGQEFIPYRHNYFPLTRASHDKAGPLDQLVGNRFSALQRVADVELSRLSADPGLDAALKTDRKAAASKLTDGQLALIRELMGEGTAEMESHRREDGYDVESWTAKQAADWIVRRLAGRISQDMREALENSETAPNEAIEAYELSAELKRDMATIAHLRRLTRRTRMTEFAPAELERTSGANDYEAYLHSKELYGDRRELWYRPNSYSFMDSRRQYVKETYAAAVNKAVLGGYLTITDPGGNPSTMALPTDGMDLDRSIVRREDWIQAAKIQSRAAKLEGEDAFTEADASLSDKALVEKLQRVYMKAKDRLGGHDRSTLSTPKTPSISEWTTFDPVSDKLLKHMVQVPFTETNEFWRAMLHAVQWTKHMSIGLSAFFYVALGESSISASGVSRNIVVDFLTDPKFRRQMLDGIKEFKRAREHYNPMVAARMRVMAEAGLEVGKTAATDKPITAVERDIERMTEAVRETRGDRAADIFHAVMAGSDNPSAWARLWPGISGKRWSDAMFSWFSAIKEWQTEQIMIQQAAKEGTLANSALLVPHEYRRRTAQYVNDTLGGQNFSQFIWATPSAMAALNLTLFAPNWTISAFLSSGLGLLTQRMIIPGLGVPAGGAPAPGQVPMIAASLVSMWVIVMQALPLALQSMAYAIGQAAGGDDDHEGDTPFPWQNEPGREDYIDMTPLARLMPWYKGDPTGKRRVYIQFAKQVHETGVLNPMGTRGWINEPYKQLMRKLSLPAKIVLEQMTGNSPGSDWDLEFKGKGILGALHSGEPGLKGLWTSRAGYIARKFIPISIGQLLENPETFPGMFIAPTSKGASQSKLVDAMTSTLATYASAKDMKTIKQVPRARRRLDSLIPELMLAARRNGYDDQKLLDTARGQVLSGLYKEMWNALDRDDGPGMNQAAAAIFRVGGTLKGLRSSIGNRERTYGVELTPEQIQAAEDAMNWAMLGSE